MRFLKQLKLLLVLGFLAGSSANAISEVDYLNQYQTQVLPFFNQVGKIASIQGERGRILPYVSFVHPHPRASIAIAAGYDENFRKYDELAYDLYRRGYSIYVLDHRGQGASRHFLKESRKAYVDLFQYFTTDFKRFVDQVVPLDPAVPRLLLAHSMGGAIGAHYLEKYPHDFAAAVLSSPMLSINLGRPEWLAGVELDGLRALGQDEEFAPGAGLASPAQPFATNTVTQSAARYAKNTTILVERPELFLSGQTVHWVIEGIRGSRFARTHGAWTKTPILLLQAGSDSIVLPDGQNLFCSQAPNCRLSVMVGAKHEILQETDAIRDSAMSQILDFFKANEPSMTGGL